jgi:hypothetical protein
MSSFSIGLPPAISEIETGKPCVATFERPDVKAGGIIAGLARATRLIAEAEHYAVFEFGRIKAVEPCYPFPSPIGAITIEHRSPP